MKLASVYFDDTVCIPGAKDTGGGVTPQDLRESCFHAADGWDIEWDGHVLFTLWREGMERPAQVGGYGFTFIAESAPAKTLSEPSVTDAAGRGDLNDRNTVNSEAAAGADGAKSKRRKK